MAYFFICGGRCVGLCTPGLVPAGSGFNSHPAENVDLAQYMYSYIVLYLMFFFVILSESSGVFVGSVAGLFLFVFVVTDLVLVVALLTYRRLVRYGDVFTEALREALALVGGTILYIIIALVLVGGNLDYIIAFFTFLGRLVYVLYVEAFNSTYGLSEAVEDSIRRFLIPRTVLRVIAEVVIQLFDPVLIGRLAAIGVVAFIFSTINGYLNARNERRGSFSCVRYVLVTCSYVLALCSVFALIAVRVIGVLVIAVGAPNGGVVGFFVFCCIFIISVIPLTTAAINLYCEYGNVGTRSEQYQRRVRREERARVRDTQVSLFLSEYGQFCESRAVVRIECRNIRLDIDESLAENGVLLGV